MSGVVNFFQAILDILTILFGIVVNFFHSLGQFLLLVFDAIGLPGTLQFYLPQVVVLSMFSVVGAGVVKVILGR